MVDLTSIGNEGPMSADQSSVRGLSSVVPGKEPPFPHLSGPRGETRAWVPTIRDERKDFGQHTASPSSEKCYKFRCCSFEQISPKELHVQFVTRKQIKILPLMRQILCQRLIQKCAAGKQKCGLCLLVICYFM